MAWKLKQKNVRRQVRYLGRIFAADDSRLDLNNVKASGETKVKNFWGCKKAPRDDRIF